MKKVRIVTMLIAAGILLVLSCEKSDPVPLLPYEGVFDRWDWHSTTTGWQVTTYADSVSYDQELEITRQGEYTWKRNDTIIRENNFIVEADTVEGNQIFFFRFQDSSRVDQSFYITKEDTLVLTDQCADCDTYKFVRK